MAVCVKLVSGTRSSSTQVLTMWQPGTMANPRILGSSFGSVVPEKCKIYECIVEKYECAHTNSPFKSIYWGR